MPEEYSNELGTVISTPDSPSPGNVCFVVNKGQVHRGQFIELDYSEGKMLAIVQNIIKTNKYFERADSVKEFENSSAMEDHFPVSEWEYVVAQTRPLGVFKGEMMKRATFPPSPGSKVSIASNNSIKKFLCLDEKGLGVGEIEYHGLPVTLSLTSLFQKHLAVLAMSGSGKSYSVSVLLEELLERSKEKGRIGVVLFDVHGEYLNFGDPASKEYKDYSSQTRIVKAKDIRIGTPKLSGSFFSSVSSSLTNIGRRELDRAIKKLRQKMKAGSGPYSLEEIKQLLEEDHQIKDNVKRPILSALEDLSSMRLFSKTDSPSITDLVKPGTLTIVDLSEINNMRKKQIMLYYFASKLFESRQQKKVCPFVLVVEEAHQFAPEGSIQETNVSKTIIETISREGRKFGASLCLISQRPVRLSTTALSQCNTHWIMRITNPRDLQHIEESSEGLDKRSIEMVTGLKTGEALIVGEAVRYPVFFKVRKKKGLPLKHEADLEASAKSFEEDTEKDLSEAEQFL